MSSQMGQEYAKNADGLPASGDALEAGRLLDALVAEKVMGWRRKPGRNVWIDDNVLTGWLIEPDDVNDAPCWAPSTDIAAAWEVVEKVMYPHGWYLAPVPDSEGWWGVFTPPDEHREVALGATAPLAICRAALKAVGAP